MKTYTVEEWAALHHAKRNVDDLLEMQAIEIDVEYSFGKTQLQQVFVEYIVEMIESNQINYQDYCKNNGKVKLFRVNIINKHKDYEYQIL